MKKFQLTYKKNNIEKSLIIEAVTDKEAWNKAVRWARSMSYDVRFLAVEEI